MRGCPFDTDKDGNCGRPLCPYCGKFAQKHWSTTGDSEMTIEEIELTTYRGEQWPRNATEAAGPIPEELWEISLAQSS